MFASPYELFKFIQAKGYVPPMAAQVTLDSMSTQVQSPAGGVESKFNGTGDHLKQILEFDRRSVFKFFYLDEPETESTWIAGDEPGKGMVLPRWAERLIHADVLVMQEKIDCTMDYLMHVLEKNKQ